mmetsp:Transcript_6672/g.18521  ORF Transcript_6672/g.18521 Transcript_6672/m.18521 type:complete len:246 (+) Transcript_6672:2038-2775(+)
MATASSKPGGGESRSSPSLISESCSKRVVSWPIPNPKPPAMSFMACLELSEAVNCLKFSFSTSGSISIANSGKSIPSTWIGDPPDTSWSNESDSECAGSVDTRSVVWPAFANLMASEAESEVLPTPPLPLIITYFLDGAWINDEIEGTVVVVVVVVVVAGSLAARALVPTLARLAGGHRRMVFERFPRRVHGRSNVPGICEDEIDTNGLAAAAQRVCARDIEEFISFVTTIRRRRAKGHPGRHRR